MSDDEHRTPDTRLHGITGRWDTSGYVIGEAMLSVVGTDTYEVLAGGHFIVHHVDVTVGKQPIRAIEIIGEPDAASGGFCVRPIHSDDRRGSPVDACLPGAAR